MDLSESGAAAAPPALLARTPMVTKVRFSPRLGMLRLRKLHVGQGGCVVPTETVDPRFNYNSLCRCPRLIPHPRPNLSIFTKGKGTV